MYFAYCNESLLCVIIKIAHQGHGILLTLKDYETGREYSAARSVLAGAPVVAAGSLARAEMISATGVTLTCLLLSAL